MRVWISRDNSGFVSIDDYVHIWPEDKKPDRQVGHNAKSIVFHRGGIDDVVPIKIDIVSFQNLFLTVIETGTCKLYKLTRKLERIK